jgi:hypothetical protein
VTISCANETCIADGSCTLWEWAESLLTDAVEKGISVEVIG